MATFALTRPGGGKVIPFGRGAVAPRPVYRTPPSVKAEMETLRGRLSKARANLSGKSDVAEILISVGVGTAIAGAMDAWELDDIFGFDARLVVGGAAIAAALFLVGKGRLSNMLLGVGVGVMAPALNDLVDGLLKGMRADAKAA